MPSGPVSVETDVTPPVAPSTSAVTRTPTNRASTPPTSLTTEPVTVRVGTTRSIPMAEGVTAPPTPTVTSTHGRLAFTR